MKKILSILLSVLLLLSTMAVLTILPAVATTTTVAIIATDGGYVNTDSVEYGVESTIIATPYYGNGFKGWFNGETLVSSNTTYTGIITSDLTAVFDVRNLIVNGDMEVVEAQADAVAVYNNAAIRYGKSNGTATAVSTNGILNTDTATYGNYVMQVTPGSTNDAGKQKGLINIPITVEKNTDYIWRFSYKFVDETSVSFDTNTIHRLYFSLDALNSSGAIPWTPELSGTKYTFHTQPSSSTVLTNVWSWGGGTSFTAFQNNNNVSTDDIWQDYYILFNPGTDSGIFTDADSNEGTIYLSLGTYNTTVDPLYIDNMSVTKADYNNMSTVTAAENGTVSADRLRTGEDYYVYTSYARGNASVYSGRDTEKVYYPTMYESYTATPNDGYAFYGWYDESGELVSTNATESLLMTGKAYTAKFASVPAVGEGGYLIDNGDGTVTAKAYFGNSFLGWYKYDAPVSTDATIKSEDFMGAVATFKKYNLIDNGDMEDGDATVINNASTGSTTIKTEDNGNKYLSLTSTTTGASFYSFQWTYALEQGKKYIISYDLRPGYDSESGYLSSEGMSFRRLIVHDKGSRSYEWLEIAFESKMAYTSGPKQTYGDTAILLPSGGTDSYPRENSTSFADNFRYYTDEWINYSILIDTTTATVTKDTDGDGTKETVSIVNDDGTIDMGLCFGANIGGTLSLDIDNVVISEYVDEYEKANSTGGYATISRRASTPVLPVVYTAHPEDGYQFAGWYDADGELVSQDTVSTFKTAGKYTAKFELLPTVSDSTEEVEENTVIDTSAIDTNDYFIPYGGVYYTDSETGETKFVDKDENGKFTAPVTGKFNIKAFLKPGAEGVATFAASAQIDTEFVGKGTLQFGSYIPEVAEGKTYGTMFVTGDWDKFVEYYKNLGWTLDELVSTISSVYDANIEGHDNVAVTAGEEVVYIYKLNQKNYMYKNNTILEYALRVRNLAVDRTCTAIGYTKDANGNYTYSKNIVSANYNALMGN